MPLPGVGAPPTPAAPSQTMVADSLNASSQWWAKLEILEAEGQPPQEVFLSAESIVVGRTPQANVILPVPYVSSAHCTLRLDQSEAGLPCRLVVRDTSSNGTFINGNLVGKSSEASLCVGQRLTFSRAQQFPRATLAQLRSPAGTASEPSSAAIPPTPGAPSAERVVERAWDGATAQDAAALGSKALRKQTAKQQAELAAQRAELTDLKSQLVQAQAQAAASDTAAAEASQAAALELRAAKAQAADAARQAVAETAAVRRSNEEEAREADARLAEAWAAQRESAKALESECQRHAEAVRDRDGAVAAHADAAAVVARLATDLQAAHNEAARAKAAAAEAEADAAAARGAVGAAEAQAAGLRADLEGVRRVVAEATRHAEAHAVRLEAAEEMVRGRQLTMEVEAAVARMAREEAAAAVARADAAEAAVADVQAVLHSERQSAGEEMRRLRAQVAAANAAAAREAAEASEALRRAQCAEQSAAVCDTRGEAARGALREMGTMLLELVNRVRVAEAHLASAAPSPLSSQVAALPPSPAHPSMQSMSDATAHTAHDGTARCFPSSPHPSPLKRQRTDDDDTSPRRGMDTPCSPVDGAEAAERPATPVPIALPATPLSTPVSLPHGGEGEGDGGEGEGDGGEGEGGGEGDVSMAEVAGAQEQPSDGGVPAEAEREPHVESLGCDESMPTASLPAADEAPHLPAADEQLQAVPRDPEATQCSGGGAALPGAATQQIAAGSPSADDEAGEAMRGSDVEIESDAEIEGEVEIGCDVVVDSESLSADGSVGGTTPTHADAIHADAATAPHEPGSGGASAGPSPTEVPPAGATAADSPVESQMPDCSTGAPGSQHDSRCGSASCPPAFSSEGRPAADTHGGGSNGRSSAMLPPEEAYAVRTTEYADDFGDPVESGRLALAGSQYPDSQATQ